MKHTSHGLGWHLLTLAALGTLALASCTRSATTETLPEEAPPEEGASTDPVVDQEATMNALLEQGQQTQTAEALAGVGGGAETPVPEATEPPPTEEPTPEPTVEPTAAGPTTYEVQPGDWIYQIARNFGVDAQAIINANPGIDPNNIQPGQVLNIPVAGEPVPGSGTTGQTTYVVQPGDNLFRIALNYNMSHETVAAANGIAPPYTVYPGQVLIIPAS